MKIHKPIITLIALMMGLAAWGATGLTKSEVRRSMQRVADWQIANYNPRIYGDVNWVNATFHLGLTRWAALAEEIDGNTFYYEWLRRLGRRNAWQVDKRMYHADDICIGQAYLDLYRKFGDEDMMKPTEARTSWVVAHPSKNTMLLDYSDGHTLERWTWCDALFMAPPVYARMYTITGDKKYLKFMDSQYRDTYDLLYDKADSLFYRDHRYFSQKESNGAKVFWGRGNGWVLGGLAEILRELPKNNKSRKFYEQLFREMSRKVVRLQDTAGFWHASLLDPEAYPVPETSSTGFFVYGLAYGINAGLLPREEYLPAVLKGWKALNSAVEEDGKLGYVQPVGADPQKVSRSMTEVYGPGAFLLAGNELYRLAEEGPVPTTNISAARIREIAAMLPDKPQGMGLSYRNREYWDSVRQTPEGRKFLEVIAPALRDQGIPPFVDSLYLDLFKTNKRLPGENMLNGRFAYLIKVTVAELLENRRRYIPVIEKALISLCKQNSWSNPAHDTSLHNFNGTDYYVDLVVATSGNSIAQCVTMLGDRLSPEVRARVACAFQQKVFRPIYRCLEETKPYWWFNIHNNWNSVCLAGVTGAALALLPNKDDRAYFVAAAEKYHVNGMKGYSDDGYCREGVGYFNYGFRGYATLREEICRATDGKIDFFHNPKFVRLAKYGRKIQMNPGVCPAYSDCRLNVAPDEFLVLYCDRALGEPEGNYRSSFTDMMGQHFSLRLMDLFPRQAWPVALDTEEMQSALRESYDPKHTYYADAALIVSRPGAGSASTLAVSAKGGNNAESHNHNDVGSYSVALGPTFMAGDGGGPHSYPGDYFDNGAEEKYKIKGSLGHPVPVVNGHAQSSGAKALGEVTRHSSTALADTFSIDCRKAYDVPELKTLDRSFVYDRSGRGAFSVADSFLATEPISFETALTTPGTWEKLDDRHLLLTCGDKRMSVEIDASGPVDFSEEQIECNSPVYTRIGIALRNKTSKGHIKLKMKEHTDR